MPVLGPERLYGQYGILRQKIKADKKPVARRLQVSASIRLASLHDVLQSVMGWTNSHLHQFEKDGKHYGVPEDDEFGNLRIVDERQFTLDQLLKREGDSLVYVYVWSAKTPSDADLIDAWGVVGLVRRDC